MNTISVKSLETPFFVGRFNEHNLVKQDVLRAIEQQQESAPLYIEDSGTGSNIERCDYIFPDPNMTREYKKILLPYFRNYMLDLINIAGYTNYRIYNMWFQQYVQTGGHTWHVHVGCQWTSVYYLDVPDDAPKTQLVLPGSNKIIELDLKDGDILTFPSFIIHRAPPVINNVKKSIISFNCCMDIDENIPYEKLNSYPIKKIIN